MNNIRPQSSGQQQSVSLPLQQHPHSLIQQQQQPQASPMRFPPNFPQQSPMQTTQFHHRQQQLPHRPPPLRLPSQNQAPPPPQGGPPIQSIPDCVPKSGCLPSPMPLSTQQQQEQTMMWAAQNYVVPYDSGIQSAVTRSVVSSCFSGVSGLSGLESECAGPEYYNAYPGGPSASGCSVVGHPGPIGSSVSRDISDGNFDYAGGPAQPMAPPPRYLVGPMPQPFFPMQQGLPMSHSDANFESNLIAAIPEFIRLLRDEDRQTVKEAAFTVKEAAKSIENARVMVKHSELINAVVASMLIGIESRDYELLKMTLGTLYTFSNTEAVQAEGLDAIIRSGVVPHLVGFLSADFEPLLYYTVTILHNLLLNHLDSPAIIRATNALSALVRLLERDHDKLLAIVTDSLRILCSSHDESKLKLCRYDAPRLLARILNHTNYEKLLWMTARLLHILCVCPDNKEAILQAGGIQALSNHLAHPSHRVVTTCLNALRILSDAATFVDNVEQLLDSLIQNLGSSDLLVVDYCLAILYNFTCKNARNKDYVCRQMGIESLTRTLNERGHCPTIAENALGTLRHLTFRWAAVQASRNKLRAIGCLPLIGRYVELQTLPREFHAHPGVFAEALSLLRNLTMGGGASWPDFRRYDIVNNTANLAVTVRMWLSDLVSSPPLLNDYMDVLERALGALGGFCADEENRRQLLEHPHIIALANDFLNHPVAKIKQAASNFLDKLHSSHVSSASSAISEEGSELDHGSELSYEADLLQQQHLLQLNAPFQQQATAIDAEEELWRRQQQQLQQHHEQQQAQRSMPMPSPMSWSQQELAAAGFANPHFELFDPSHETLDCPIPSGLLNEVDFDMGDDVAGVSGHPTEQVAQAPDNVAGPSFAPCPAVEPMKKLHL